VSFLNWPVLIAVVAALLVLRWRRAGMLTWAIGWWLGLLVVLKYGFVTPIPASVRSIYMWIATAAIAAYVSSDRRRWESFHRPLLELVLEPRRRLALVVLVLALPALAAVNVWMQMSVPLEAPAFGRTVHPAPPDTITVHDSEIDLRTGSNPFRALEHDDPEAYRAHLENGRRVYFQNCFYCHGDAMAGDGLFVHGLNPIPTNFTDAGILPMFEETFLFWRVSKGGPGMPEEGGPWDSAMPVWEQMLTEEEMWDVVMYLFDYTGYTPRAKTVHH
jgi:mono/diheme cytochrome c family protein